YQQERSRDRTSAERPAQHQRAWLSWATVVGSIALLVAGAELLVTGATSIARAFHMSEAVIGLSLVAIDTSLPEVATAIVAAIRRQPDVVLGNVIGSNIFTILCILGVTTMIHPITVEPHFRDFDALV